MIQLNKPEDCVGCHACVQVCPKKCFVMEEDHEGFLYPKVDLEQCTDCGLCEKVCPVIHQGKERKPLVVYAAKNKNEEIRKKSSSGGIFTLLAEQIIDQEGIVFGARFDKNWNVTHDYVETKEDLKVFRGSKYVQSCIGNNYFKVRSFLKSGRKVLFSGTPCQIAGLKGFLGKEYENLFCVDFICHGVPSPKVWSYYLQKISNNNINDILSISFRNKESGWKNYSFELKHKSIIQKQYASENVFMRGFISDLYLRPSCHKCPAKKNKSYSDLTIADFWGIQNINSSFDDDLGSSLILLHTDRGKRIFKSVNDDMSCSLVDYDLSISANISINESSKPHLKREYFFRNLRQENIIVLIEKCIYKTIINRFIDKIKRLF